MIRVTNRTRDIVTLPAPYQGILMAYRSEVIDTTEAEFVTAIGGLDTAGGVFTIESVGASVAATVVVDQTLTEVDLVTNIDHVETGYAYTQNILVNTSVETALVEMTGVGGAELEEGVIYTVKDVGGNAETKNITVDHAGGHTFDGATEYVISTNYASVGFYREGSTFIPLPGVSSGGSSLSTSTIITTPGAHYVGFNVILCDTTAGIISVNLQKPGGLLALDDNTLYYIKDTGNAATNLIYVNPPIPKLIDGAANLTITANYGSVTIVREAATGNFHVL